MKPQSARINNQPDHPARQPDGKLLPFTQWPPETHMAVLQWIIDNWPNPWSVIRRAVNHIRTEIAKGDEGIYGHYPASSRATALVLLDQYWTHP